MSMNLKREIDYFMELTVKSVSPEQLQEMNQGTIELRKRWLAELPNAKSYEERGHLYDDLARAELRLAYLERVGLLKEGEAA